MKRPRVLITDDHALLAEGLASLLQSAEYEVVGIASDGRQMLSDASLLNPDLITLDIGMPGLNGLEAAKRVRKLLPQVKIVFVTQQVDIRYLQAGIKAGANGFVAKQSASSELLEALREVLRGRRYITHSLDKILQNLELEGRNPLGESTEDPLTDRQREVLQLLAEGHTNKDIADRLAISPKTVEFHRAAIMSSLGIYTTAELTRYALSRGIVTS